MDGRVSQTGILRLSLAVPVGCGAPLYSLSPLIGNVAFLLIGRIIPGVALRLLNDPGDKRITQCLHWLAHAPASSVRGSLPSGLQRLTAQLAALHGPKCDIRGRG